MYPVQRQLILLILLGGSAVLGSYILGALVYPNAGEVLWGRVPENMRPFYTAGMFLAAAGYFAYTYFILFCLKPQETRVGRRFGYGIFSVLYAAILIPSALWLPLTALAVESASLALVWVVRFALAVVGAASVGLFIALLKVEPRRPVWAQRSALIGSAIFSIHTALLDAIVWSALFRL